MFVEIIAHTLNDVMKINKTTADRIELCGDMDQDGLTPKLSLIKSAAENTKKPIRVMIRNHNHSFVYTEKEVCEMVRQIEYCNQFAKIEGYVFGCLDESQTAINIEQMKRLIKAAKGKKITFHKACDRILSKENLELLIDLNVDTILTQGGQNPIMENQQVITELGRYNDQIQILLGGGVNFENYRKLVNLSPNIHLGSAVREQKSYDEKISIEAINALKEF